MATPTINDPTRTKTLRAKWVAEVNRRFRAVRGKVNRYDFQPTDRQRVATNASTPFVYTYDPGATAAFMSWFQTIIDELILEGGPRDSWQNPYLTEAYRRGLISAQQDIGEALTSEVVTAAELRLGQLTGLATGGAGLTSRTLALTVHADALRVLYSRDYAELEGVTAAMSQQVARVLAQGIERGEGPKKLAAAINDRVDKIGATRAKLIARTETVRAHSLANIYQGDEVGRYLGEPVQYIWISSNDGRVRPLHVDRNRLVYDRARVLTLIGEPNCRCAVRIYVEDLRTEQDRTRDALARARGFTIIGENQNG